MVDDADRMEVNDTRRTPRWGLIISLIIATVGGLGYFAYFIGTPSRPERLPGQILVPSAERIDDAKLGEEGDNSVRYRQQFDQVVTDSTAANIDGRAVPPVDLNSSLSKPTNSSGLLSEADAFPYERRQPANPALDTSRPSLRLVQTPEGPSNDQAQAMIAAAIRQWAPKPSQLIQPYSGRVDPAPQSPSVTTISSNDTPQKMVEKEKTLIPAGEILYAVAKTGADSDIEGRVIVRLVGLDFGEADLIGTYSLAGNWLDINFTNMAIKDGPTIPVAAQALNLKTLTPGVRSSLDRRWMARYGAPFLASFLGGFGEALQSGTTTTQIVGGQQTTVEERNFTLEDQLLIGAGTASGELASDLRSQAQGVRQQAKLAVNEGIAVLFVEDVKGQINE